MSGFGLILHLGERNKQETEGTLFHKRRQEIKNSQASSPGQSHMLGPPGKNPLWAGPLFAGGPSQPWAGAPGWSNG